MRWKAQQAAQQAARQAFGRQRRSSYLAVQRPEFDDPRGYSSYTHPTDIAALPRTNYVSPWPPIDYHTLAPVIQQSHTASHVHNQQLPPYSTLAQLAGSYGTQPRYEPASSHTVVPSSRMPSSLLQAKGAQHKLPPVGIFPPLPKNSAHDSLLIRSQSVNHRPIESEAQQDTSFVTPTRQRTRPSHTGPSPGHDGVTPPDKKAMQKKEAYRKKGEQLRRKRQARQAAAGPKPTPTQRRPSQPTTLGGMKRKADDRSLEVTAPTLAPSLRRTPGTEGRFPQLSDTFSTKYGPSPNTPSYQHDYPQTIEMNTGTYGLIVPFGMPSQYSQVRPEPPKPKYDPDAQEQKIYEHYKYYHWSVMLYEVDPNGQYDYAQSWLEDLFASNLPPDEYRWESHTTTGFIKHGDRLSFLAIHNAANPFGKHQVESTTAIGVYGYHWYNHNNIHWKTFAPGIRWLLDWCVENNGIRMKQKWKANEPKATERRFHKAYWLAANRQHLNNLLNHSEDMVNKPHDVPDQDEDDGFVPEETDLTNECCVDIEEAEESWQNVLDDMEFYGDDAALGYQHVVTGRSEGW